MVYGLQRYETLLTKRDVVEVDKTSRESTCKRYFNTQVTKSIKYNEYSIKYELKVLPVLCI